jgi:pilus biogenesis lipoprotein CpaD
MSGGFMRKAVAPAVLVLLWLGGCADQKPDLSGLPEQQTPKQVQVVRRDQTLVLRVEPQRGKLAPGEAGRLTAFLADLPHPGQTELALRGAQPRAVLERVAHTLAGVAHRPIRIMPRPAGATPPPSSDQVEFVAAEYTVVSPSCPDWSRTDALGDQNSVSSNFGCADAGNFAQMLADPKDLVAGRASATTAAGPAADAVTLWRTDKVKEIPSNKAAPPFVIEGGR